MKYKFLSSTVQSKLGIGKNRDQKAEIVIDKIQTIPYPI